MIQQLNCILVIDDDEATNFLTKIIIEKSGCTKHLQFAESAKEALDYLAISESGSSNETHPSPDLILLDINMPAMNGWEFLEEYKSIGFSSKIIIIMVTTSLFPDDKIKAEETEELSGFLSKPLTQDKIVNIMKAHFQTQNQK